MAADTDEFEVVESEPDSVTDSSSEDGDENSQQDLDFMLSPTDANDEAQVRERVRRISEVKIGPKEFCQAIDWYMVKIFWQSIGLFLAVVFVATIIYLTLVYKYSEDTWYEFFPVSDDEGVDQPRGGVKARQEEL